MMFSIVIPVYRNVESLQELIDELSGLHSRLHHALGVSMEAVFVVDGNPDGSYEVLERRLPSAPFPSKLLLHSRNFGSFSAIRSGLRAASGDYLGVMAADLQEPASLQEEFLTRLMTGDYDIVVGSRAGRDDSLFVRLASAVFWRLYRLIVSDAIPKGGVDVFACNRRFSDELLQLPEANSSMIGLIFWLGFRRTQVLYRRRARAHGKSAWSLGRKVTYLLDSLFSFTDVPVRLLMVFGLLGVLVASSGGAVVFLARIFGDIPVPGYAATMLMILFFGGLNALGLGIVGSYAWRGYENTKHRPLAVVLKCSSTAGNGTSSRQDWQAL
ncbi:MAG TPA: glycosyltransferase family 2 protein [Nitrospira sp.]|nr:glycosyltransferase family 2 protein [Nitrospira sp.]